MNAYTQNSSLFGQHLTTLVKRDNQELLCVEVECLSGCVFMSDLILQDAIGLKQLLVAGLQYIITISLLFSDDILPLGGLHH